MSMPEDDIRRELKAFILREFLPGDGPSGLTDETPLFTDGILDSISILQFIVFIEKKFGIKMRGDDVTRGSLNTIISASQLIRSKAEQQKKA